MLIVSSRKNFVDPDHLSDEDQIRDIPEHHTALNSKQVSKQDFLTKTAKQKILLLVHGYNNDQEEVLDAYDIIKMNVLNHINKEYYDDIIGYSWPGGDHGVEYFSAKSRANGVARRFRSFLIDMKANLCTIDVIAHSMGNRVTLKALKDAPEHLLRNVFTMAAAVNNESLEPKEEFYPSTEKCERIFVYHSKNDSVLEKAYRIAEISRALGYSGPEDVSYAEKRNVNVWTINCKHIIKSHGDYKRSDKIFKHINKSLISISQNKWITKFVTLR